MGCSASPSPRWRCGSSSSRWEWPAPPAPPPPRTLAGFAIAGWFAGRRALFSHFFHGATAAMGIALAVVVTAVVNGSQRLPQVVLLAALAIAVGGLSAHLAARTKAA